MSTEQKIPCNCLLKVLEGREQRPEGNNFLRNVYGLHKQSTFSISCAKFLTASAKNQFIKVVHGSEFTVCLKILKCILLLPFDTHAHPSQADIPYSSFSRKYDSVLLKRQRLSWIKNTTHIILKKIPGTVT